jgi:hypothetical protein
MASDRPFHVCQLPDERGCTFNSECPDQHQVCGIDGQCRDQCVADRDCLAEQTCVSATCADNKELVDGGLVPASMTDAGAPASGIPCLYTSDCHDNLVCRNQICSNECLKASDCSQGDCVDHRCSAGSGSFIGPEGGVVAGGKVKLTIPPHSLRTAVSILILPLDAWPAGAVGPVYQILPNGLAFDPPASLAYTFDAADIGQAPADQLKLANAVGSKWTALDGSTVDAANSTVTAPLAHLSTYGLIGPEVDASAGGGGGAGGAGGAAGGGGARPGDSGISTDASAVVDAAIPQ